MERHTVTTFFVVGGPSDGQMVRLPIGIGVYSVPRLPRVQSLMYTSRSSHDGQLPEQDDYYEHQMTVHGSNVIGRFMVHSSIDIHCRNKACWLWLLEISSRARRGEEKP